MLSCSHTSFCPPFWSQSRAQSGWRPSLLSASPPLSVSLVPADDPPTLMRGCCYLKGSFSMPGLETVGHVSSRALDPQHPQRQHLTLYWTCRFPQNEWKGWKTLYNSFRSFSEVLPLPQNIFSLCPVYPCLPLWAVSRFPRTSWKLRAAFYASAAVPSGTCNCFIVR